MRANVLQRIPIHGASALRQCSKWKSRAKFPNFTSRTSFSQSNYRSEQSRWHLPRNLMEGSDCGSSVPDEEWTGNNSPSFSRGLKNRASGRAVFQTAAKRGVASDACSTRHFFPLQAEPARDDHKF